jgi:hypothetical protein
MSRWRSLCCGQIIYLSYYGTCFGLQFNLLYFCNIAWWWLKHVTYIRSKWISEHLCCNIRSRDSSVGIATRYGLEGPGIESHWRRDIPHLSRPALGPTQPPVQWVLGLSRGKGGRDVTLTTHPHLVPRSWKSRAIPLLPLWARVACYRVKPYPTLCCNIGLITIGYI